MTRSILITGGNGMVGRALQRAFADLEPKARIQAPSRHQLDCLDQNQTAAFFQSQQRPFDLVIHCAARVGGIQANTEYPTEFLYENTLLNLHILEQARRAGTDNLIYLGSSCMYPRDYRMPLHEDDLLAAPLEPTNEGYALAKLTGARYCEYSNRQFDTNFKVIIPPNLYGSHDHFEPHRSHLIAAIIAKVHEAVVEDHPAVTIWGDGSARREFLFVEDLARYLATLPPDLSEIPDYLNVGLGRDYTVREYYEIAADIIGFSGNFEFDETKPTGMKQKLIDSTRAFELGWKPQTTIEEGMAATYEYFISQLPQG